MAEFRRNFFIFFIISIIVQNVSTNDSSINQNINQKIKGASAGSINQIISQDIKNDHCQKSNSSINQNINQDVESTHGQGPDCINQNIHQKVSHGSTLIDQKSFRAIKNHDKRSHSSCCGKEVIFKRHRSNCGCNNEDSSEEIKFCDESHSSEIIFKNREKNCGDLSESSSEEIQFKYGCNNKKKSCQFDTSKEIVLPKLVCRPCLPKNDETNCECNDSSSSEEEIRVTKKKYKKPCGLNCKNSEEWDIKTWIRPCEDYKRYDVSSEEKTCTCKPEENKSSEEKAENEENPCPCQDHIKSEETSEETSSEETQTCSCSEGSSEEIIQKVFKYIPYRRPAVQKSFCSTCQKEPCDCYKNGYYF